MTFEETYLGGSYIITPQLRGDGRGWFTRTYCKDEFLQINHSKEWVQINHSFSAVKGTIRGMHFQKFPHSEIKLLRCISGAVYDVIIDLREKSSTYLKYFGTELSATNRRQLYIPQGFAHGFQTLTDNVELIYHHTEYYSKSSEGGVRYDDPSINIQWPLPVSEISERDISHPNLDVSRFIKF